MCMFSQRRNCLHFRSFLKWEFGASLKGERPLTKQFITRIWLLYVNNEWVIIYAKCEAIKLMETPNEDCILNCFRKLVWRHKKLARFAYTKGIALNDPSRLFINADEKLLHNILCFNWASDAIRRNKGYQKKVILNLLVFIYEDKC